MHYEGTICLRKLIWALLFVCCLQAANTSGEDGSSNKETDDSSVQMDMSKRDWNRNLHSWGKRAWQNLQNGWGKRDLWGPSSSYPLYVSEKRAWKNLQNAWGKRYSPEEEYATKLAALLDEEESPQYGIDYASENDLENEDEKRSWRALNGGSWGKRAEWGNFRGSWGKREPAWTNLKGIWGKRSLPVGNIH